MAVPAAPNSPPPKAEVGWAWVATVLKEKAGALLAPKAGAEPNPNAGVLLAPNTEVLLAPNAGVLPAPNREVLLAPKAGVLPAPNGDGVLPPKAGAPPKANAGVPPAAGAGVLAPNPKGVVGVLKAGVEAAGLGNEKFMVQFWETSRAPAASCECQRHAVIGQTGARLGGCQLRSETRHLGLPSIRSCSLRSVGGRQNLQAIAIHGIRSAGGPSHATPPRHPGDTA